VSTAVKAFVGCEFVGLELDDDCCEPGQKFAGNDRFAWVSHCSVAAAAAAVVVAVVVAAAAAAVDVESMVVKAFVGCESDSVLDSRGCYAANVAPL